ncbi:MAG: ATP-dependent DNA helicase RecG [Psychrilyobacter sp.]|nr:ATP-dependent DNA helicase RecG [Psychrilyobacter sp.]
MEKIDLKGVGEKTLTSLRNLGIRTIMDLITYYPRTYEDRSNIKKIGDIRSEEYVVVIGSIISIENRKTRTRKTMTIARITDGTGILDLVWFQMPYLKKSLEIGEKYIFIGNVKRGYNFQISSPEYRKYNGSLSEEVKPIYSMNRGLTQNTIRKIIKATIKKYLPLVEENIPLEIRKEYKLIGRKEGILKIHMPKTLEEIEEAKSRFAVEELLILELGILSKRFQLDASNSSKYKLNDDRHMVKKYMNSLGFELTRAQKKVITEIYKDLSQGKIVNRLIQGDVGSGKTIVAILMLLYLVENGYQGVIMAPTEILATQHYLSVVDDLRELGVRVEILTGSIKGKKREKLLAEIKAGVVDIVVGTHALIEDHVEFQKLGLIVVDEQHRFGVEQRKKLRDKGEIANLLVMSATPIPRSLALSIYGDLDVSIIDELPPGRTPIKTKWIESKIDTEKAYEFIRKQLVKGRQCYMVAPLIEESEKLAVKSATELYEEMIHKFPEFKIGLLHGKLKNTEKELIMQKFKKNNIQILVSTTVIEVGVNVPNATIMMITNANRFGLAGLHQLRGRVGRGQHKSYCFLVAKTDNDISKSRLKVMESTTDGFLIAEEDLRLRKPGEIFGTRQSGISDLKFVDIVHDVKTIKLVRDISIDYLKRNDGEIKEVPLRVDIVEKFKVDEIK